MTQPGSPQSTVDHAILHDLLAQLAAAQADGRRLALDELTNDPHVLAELRRRHDFEATAEQTFFPATHDPDWPTVPGYELREVIGRGGMGLVYRGQDTTLMRDVAIKVLLPEFARSASTLRRFGEEAQITGQLQHPGIPPVHEVGTLADGRPFLAMKLVKGRTLDAILKGRPDPKVDLGRMLVIFEQVCQAVAYAHSRAVIHRDLKPGNVMVGAFGEVQVMDWGLAKVLGAPIEFEVGGAEERTKICDPRAKAESYGTQAGSVVGTPAYMPPEQAASELTAVDRRSDVFGLGGLLCAILTGQPPFVGPDSEAVRLLAVRGKLEGAHARLDACGADPELVSIAKHCLSPEPKDRPSDADVVATAIATHRAGLEQRVRQAELDRAAADARAVEQRKRRQVQLGLAIAIGLLLMSIGSAFWVVDQQRRERRFEKIQTVTDIVARLEQWRDRGREFPEYPESIEIAEDAKQSWQKAAFALGESSDILERFGETDANLANRISLLRREIPDQNVAATGRVARTRVRVESIKRAQLAASRRHYKAALSNAGQAADAEPEVPEHIEFAGDLHAQSGDYASACQKYLQAIKLAKQFENGAARKNSEIKLSLMIKIIDSKDYVDKLLSKRVAMPVDLERVCELAEMALIRQYFRWSTELFELAFRGSPKLFAQYRLVAALAATMAGLGVGESDEKITPQKFREYQMLAAGWLPKYQTQIKNTFERGDHKPILDSLIRFDGFDASRYASIRSILPTFVADNVSLYFTSIMILSRSTDANSSGTYLRYDRTDFAAAMPFPDKNFAVNQGAISPADKLQFDLIRSIVERHLLVGHSCGVRRPRGRISILTHFENVDSQV